MPFLGVVGDTHVPGRMKELPENLPDFLAGASLILHTGDISQGSVLDQLRLIAPVLAVRGNADLSLPLLPLRREFTFEGIPIALTHSHGGMLGYLYERWVYFTRGYTYEFHYNRVRKFAREAKVVVFGHTHNPYIKWRDGKLFFNPGSLAPMYFPLGTGPKAGKIYVENGKIWGEITDIRSGRTICAVPPQEI